MSRKKMTVEAKYKRKNKINKIFLSEKGYKLGRKLAYLTTVQPFISIALIMLFEKLLGPIYESLSIFTEVSS